MSVDNAYVDFDRLKAFFKNAPIERAMSQTECETWLDYYGLEVERLSQMAWRSVTVTDEYQTIHQNPSQGPYYYIYNIHLKHPHVRSLTKLEVFNGDDWDDWIADGKTEGRGDDYWVDYENGIVYINGYMFIRHGFDARVTYTWGKSTIDTDARELNLRYMARHLYSMPNFIKTVPEAKDNENTWQRNEDRILQLESRMGNTMTLINQGAW